MVINSCVFVCLFADWKTCTAVAHQRQKEQHRIAAQRTRQPHTQDQPRGETVWWLIVLKISSKHKGQSWENILMMSHDRGEA